MNGNRWAWTALWIGVGCGTQGGGGDAVAPPAADGQTIVRPAEDPEAPGPDREQPPWEAEPAPPATRRSAPLASQKDLATKLSTYLETHAERRVHVQVDKPLYKPGETVWIKAWDLGLQGFGANPVGSGYRFKLISPKGAEVLKKRVRGDGAGAANDFVVPEGVPGGEYVVRVEGPTGEVAERPIIVSTYEAPRVKKKLEFVRKAYGAGDEVAATVELKRPTGEPLAAKVVRGQIVADGRRLPEVQATTNASGGAVLRFTLPDQLERGDVLLTALVDERGVTESVSKRVPVVLKKLELALFPEGGDLVEGLPSRVYFEAKNTLGKPADVSGEIVDDQGQVVQRFESYKNGLGRFDFVPNTGRTYRARVTHPVGISETYAMPLPKGEGCVLRTYDDPDGQVAELRAAVHCSEARTVIVAGTVRETIFDAATVAVPGGGESAVVYLASDDSDVRDAMGMARVTVFTDALVPLAERVVFRNRRKGLGVKVEPDRPSYAPRDEVTLAITTTNAEGTPVPAELALAVVDDTVISFADDKQGHLLSKMLLEPELPGEVEEPNFYFDLEEEMSAFSMELLVGARGWRRFEWQPVLQPVLRRMAMPAGAAWDDAMPLPAAAPMPMADFDDEEAVPEAEPEMELAEGAPMEPPADANKPEPPARRARRPVVEDRRDEPAADEKMGPPAKPVVEAKAKKEVVADVDWARAKIAAVEAEPPPEEWAPVRVFPRPDYPEDYGGPRTDFRETVHWEPAVRTDAQGRAEVKFHVSDAVTSFRVFAEGAGSGAIGRAEQVIESKLPFSMEVKLPLEVSAGDRLELPLTINNERDRQLDVGLQTNFGGLLTLREGGAPEVGVVPASSGRSVYFPLDVTGTMGTSKVRFAAMAGGLSDEFVRELTVVPLGFPQFHDASGTVGKGEASETFDLGDADPQTASAVLKVYTSPLSTIVGGLEGLIREPGGCFEQTSSSNYPNVMVMQYLQTHDVAAPELLERTGPMLERGYRKLVGFETGDKGYEWFGQSPPHEALSAYGVLEFVDMKNVLPDVDQKMIERTVAYLQSRRDGEGGFLRNDRALDTFGRASEEVTDAYITYAIAEAGLAAAFPREIETQERRSGSTKDPYLLALAANTLLGAPGREQAGAARVDRLVQMQDADGSWQGADHSITRSGGENLVIETTSLAAMALMRVGHPVATRRAMSWLSEHRNGFGQWGATQATVLALKAMTLYAAKHRVAPSDGEVEVLVNGRSVQRISYQKGTSEPLVVHLAGALKSGSNTLTLRHRGDAELPYSLAVEYRATKPATHPHAKVGIETALAATRVKMGENVRMNVVVENRTDVGQPMTLARVGLPGGLTYQTWQLEELRDEGRVAFYETRAREVILYFRDLEPSERKEIPLDLVAGVPGHYQGPSSAAYLYYTDDEKFWAAGLGIQIDRP